MTWLRVRNFSELQHYKDRPDNPWIRFYVHLLDDEEMNALPVSTRLLWDRLLLLAQRFGNVIPSDPERVAKLTCIEVEACREGIAQLLKGRWLSETATHRRASRRASSVLAQSRGRAEKIYKGSSAVRPPARTRGNSLPSNHEQEQNQDLAHDLRQELDKIMPLLNNADPKSRKVVERAAAGLPLAAVAKVRESAELNGPVGVGYVVNALKSERAER